MSGMPWGTTTATTGRWEGGDERGRRKRSSVAWMGTAAIWLRQFARWLEIAEIVPRLRLDHDLAFISGTPCALPSAWRTRTQS